MSAAPLWKPVQGSPVAYQDDHIIVYKDGTWKSQTGDGAGWVMHADAHVYGNGSDGVTLTTVWGHSKVSLVTGPNGVTYDVRAIAESGTA